jgi:tetratricopeptide (TPR) repeat protein
LGLHSRDVTNDEPRPEARAAARAAEPPARRSWPWWAALAGAVTLSFLPALGCGFTNWDDPPNFIDNPYFRGLSPAHLKWMFSTFLLGHYQPLSWVTLGADYLVWGMNPLGYHLSNLTIHAVGVVLFFEVLRALFRLTPSLAEIGESWRDRGAFVGALLFGIHPFRVESVAWVTERRDVLCGVFFLLSVGMYLRRHETSSRGLPSGKAYGLSVLFFGLSLFSKALGIALPAVLLLLDRWPLGRFGPGRRRACLLEKVPYLLVALLDGILMIFAMRHIVAVQEFRQYALWERALQAGYGLCFYIGKSFLPIGLAPIYPIEISTGPTQLAYGASSAAAVGVTILLIVRRKQWPALSTGWVSYALLVSPVLGLVVTGRQVTADRYTYLACLPLAAILGGAFAKTSPARFVRLGAAAAGVLLALGILTFRQIGIWRNGRTLWEQEVRLFPGYAEGFYFRGMALRDEKDLAGALRDFDRTLQLDPKFHRAYYVRGTLKIDLGNSAGALSDLNEFLRYDPMSEHALYHRGLAQLILGNSSAAYSDFTLALALDPTRVEAWINRANLDVASGDLDRAAAGFDRALELSPGLEAALFNRGNLYLRRGNAAAALKDYSSALERSRDPKILVQRGNAQASLGQVEAAIQDYSDAILLDPASFNARVNRAGAFASRGQWKRAADDYEAALRLAPPGWEHRETIQKLLDESRAKQ